MIKTFTCYDYYETLAKCVIVYMFFFIYSSYERNMSTKVWLLAVDFIYFLKKVLRSFVIVMTVILIKFFNCNNKNSY